MNHINRYNKHSIISRYISVAVCILLAATSLTVALDVTNVKTTDNNYLSYSFTFIKPELQTPQGSQYTTLQMQGCMVIGKQAGDPMLPVKSVKLLLPAMTTVKSITITGTSVELASIEDPVFPYQNPVPIGFEPEEFQFNITLYSSDEVYPSDVYDGYHIGYCRGYAILDIMLNPMQYIPSEGRLFYYPELTVTVDLEDAGEINQLFRNNPDDKAWVETLVYNPDVTNTYTIDLLTSEYPGGLCDPSDDYDYVIITTTKNDLNYWPTTNSTPYNWDSLMDKHEDDDDLKCTLVTIQDIDDCDDYYDDDPLFDDLEAHIREFCKDAYEDWGISYIFVGGDAEWIPARLMDSTAEARVDSDIYWSNLDETFNDDQDNQWGEEGDSGFDLYSELFIGRITCDTPQDVSNWMTKSFYYADNGDKDYLENAAFYGGDTGWQCQGDDFIDYSAIKGTDRWLGPSPSPHPSWLGFQYGFETWNAENPGNEYNMSVAWTAEPPNPGWKGGSGSAAINGLKNDINNDQVVLISAIAHANEHMSMDVYRTSWEADYHNTKPFFIHDYGCHCGDMDAADDGVLHSMLFHSDTELAFACVYNTGYGWGNQQSTRSSSALQQKLFWAYMFDVTNNSGGIMNWQLGKAMAHSRDTMAPTIDWGGSWREIIQCCLLFGDPAQQIKSITLPPEKPQRPEGPTEGIIGVEYTFSTSTTDPEGKQVLYRWNWGDDTSTIWLGPYNSGDTVESPPHSWGAKGDFDITVKAKNVNGGESDRSDPLSIHILQSPILDISIIHGGILRVRTTIKNTGEVEATNVDCSIIIEGGTILFGRETNGTIVSIPAGGNITIYSGPIIGFGEVSITATAEIPESSDTRQQSAFVLLFFIKVDPSGN